MRQKNGRKDIYHDSQLSENTYNKKYNRIRKKSNEDP